MQKNDIINVEIIDNGMNFEGVAKVDNLAVFIQDAIIGENIDTKILKVANSFAFGKIEQINRASQYRQESICEVFKTCGGCACQHIEYNFSLNLKTKIVENCLKKQNVEFEKLTNCIGMGLPYYYRNKVQYPVRFTEKLGTRIGFYAKRTHDIVKNDCCYIQNRIVDMVAKEVYKNLVNAGFNGYDETYGSGDIRNIMVRRGFHTSEIMIVIVVNKKELLSDNRIGQVLKETLNTVQNVKGFFLNLNTSDTNEILGDTTKCIYGDKYISDYIGEYKFCISPKSFFQVNTAQTEILYNTLFDSLDLKGNEVVFDLYSGVGTIGIFLSKMAKKVYGIEIEKEAVEMANLNIKENGIENCEYIAGSVEDKIIEFEQRGIKPDVIVVDPPRKGLDEKSIEYMIKFNPEKIGYVSCNPATMARDLKILSNSYNIKRVMPVDMFPQTSHVEVVCLLERKTNFGG